MRLKVFELSDTDGPFWQEEISEKLHDAISVEMKPGYPHGTDGSHYMMFYAIFENEEII